MGWLRALLGQKLWSLSRSFAALFVLFVRLGYPNLARGALEEICPHYTREQSNPSARMKKHQYLGDDSRVTGGLKKVREAISTSMIPKINEYVNLAPQEHTVLRHRDVPGEAM